MKRIALAAAALILPLTHMAAHGQDIEDGKTVFKKCLACHATDTTTNKVGPHLGDVIGRTAGTVPGFAYSDAMKQAGSAGLVWDDATLTEYLAAPKAKVPGTKMAFAGLKKPDDVANLLAYLHSLKD